MTLVKCTGANSAEPAAHITSCMFVSRFKNSDRRYIQIKRIAGQVVNRLLAEQQSLLTSALIAVVEVLPCHYVHLQRN